jgi:hypothetical protein
MDETTRELLRILSEVAVERNGFLARQSPARKRKAARAMVGFLLATRGGVVDEALSGVRL